MKKGNCVTAIICMAFSIFVFVMAKDFPAGTNGVPGPGVFPMIISSLLFFCSLIILVFSISVPLEGEKTITLGTKDNRRVYISMVGLVIYAIILPFLGFLITNAIMLFVAITLFKQKRSYSTALIALLVSLVVYVIFTRVLQVPLDFGLVAF